MSRERIGGPEGIAAVRPHYLRRYWNKPAPDLSDCLASYSAGRSWLLHIWEPLITKAPAPPKAAPYCCYIQTVIFYHYPHVVWPWPRFYRGNDGRLCVNSGPSFLQWDQIEARLTIDDQVGFRGDVFEITGGQVLWRERRWWMRYGARRCAAPARMMAA